VLLRGDPGEQRVRFDFERSDVFGVTLDAVTGMDALADELARSRADPAGDGFRRFSSTGRGTARLPAELRPDC
jgi:hypothetical protein